MRAVIVIKGESAKSLMSVGANDLKNHFVPKGLMVDEKDIEKCYIEGYFVGGKEVERHECLSKNIPYKTYFDKADGTEG
jgi:hypothetical protein